MKNLDNYIIHRGKYKQSLKYKVIKKTEEVKPIIRKYKRIRGVHDLVKKLGLNISDRELWSGGYQVLENEIEKGYIFELRSHWMYYNNGKTLEGKTLKSIKAQLEAGN